MTDQPPRHRDAAATRTTRDGRAAALREHDALLAGVRHELRTPLNAVLGYSELLMEDAANGGYEALLPDLRRIHAAGDDLLALTGDVLDPARDGALPPPDQAALQAALRSALQAPAEQLCGEIERLLAAATANGMSALLPDLRRIHAATTRFLALSADASPAAAVPAPDTVAAAPTDSVVPGTAVRRSPSSVLIVDDQAVNRDLLARRLRREGHAVSVAEDGGQALRLVAEGHFNLVLLDVVMPGLDGYAVLERLKADPATRDIPVIMISALDEFDSAVRCIALGAEDYLPKPFDPTLLRARIGASLEKKRLRDQERAHLLAIEARDAELAALNRTLGERVRQQVEELERLGRLRRFLSPQLAEVIVAQGDESLLASHRREITAAYCALRGFAAFAEVAQPEDVMGVLGEYHAALGPLVFAHEGTLERFAGDGMMVCFNDPVPCPDPAWRAVQMTIAMRERAGELSRRWLRRGHELDLVAGIAIGYATCGRIGFEGRFDYAAIGAVTNLATRLCDRALPGQILVSARAHAEVEGRVVAEPGDAVPMEGAGRPVPVFNVLGMASPPQAAAAPVPAGLSAREVEVLRLVAEGLTDAQVAERLFLSTRTINQHLRSIYNKLGVSTRAAATRFAIEHGLA